jgi:hypothetical protein
VHQGQPQLAKVSPAKSFICVRVPFESSQNDVQVNGAKDSLNGTLKQREHDDVQPSEWWRNAHSSSESSDFFRAGWRCRASVWNAWRICFTVGSLVSPRTEYSVGSTCLLQHTRQSDADVSERVRACRGMIIVRRLTSSSMRVMCLVTSLHTTQSLHCKARSASASA